MSATIEIGPVVAALNRIANAEHASWITAVGEREKALIQERIRTTKQDPDGHDWAPWRPFTKAKREAQGNAGQGLLWDTGELLQSPTYLTPFGAELEIGTDVDYAKVQQEGIEGHMAARPFIGWSEADQVWLETSLVEHLQTLLA